MKVIKHKVSNESKVEDAGLQERYNYTVYPDDSITTKCILFPIQGGDKDKAVAIGYSICSQLDKFSGIKGRAKALGRAVASLEHKTSKEECKVATSMAASVRLHLPLSIYRNGSNPQ